MEEDSSDGPRATEMPRSSATARQRPAVLGLIGGVASGKSLVAAQFAELGAAVLDGDRAGHEVLRLPEVEQAIRQRWGESVFDHEGHVRRAALAEIVFRPDDVGRRELNYLQQMTHPRIGELLTRRLQEEMANSRRRAIVLDAPVMLEAGWAGVCDKLVYVDASRDVRLARAKNRGWSEEDFNRREQAQETLEAKRARAHLVIDNSGSAEDTRRQVEQIWQTFGSS